MKMRKGIILGLVLGIIFSYAIASATTSFTKNLTVHYGLAKKILIDGIDKTPTTTLPFVYEGTTYVPLRYVSEALGKPVNWEGSTGTIYIGERSGQSTYLTDIPLYSYDNVLIYRIDNSTADNKNLINWSYYFSNNYVMKAAGKEYSKGISIIPRNYSNPTSLIFNLNGEYASLTGILNYADQWMERAGKDIIKFYVDDMFKGEYTIEKGKLPQDFEINVKNGLQLKIQIIRPDDSKGDNPVINLLDLKLKK